MIVVVGDFCRALVDDVLLVSAVLTVWYTLRPFPLLTVVRSDDLCCVAARRVGVIKVFDEDEFTRICSSNVVFCCAGPSI